MRGSPGAGQAVPGGDSQRPGAGREAGIGVPPGELPGPWSLGRVVGGVGDCLLCVQPLHSTERLPGH